MDRREIHLTGQGLVLCVVLLTMVLPVFGGAGVAAANEGTQHYKMLSSLEYSGKTQHKNQVETLVTVEKQALANDRVKYSISSREFDLAGGNTSGQPSSGGLSFVVDRETRRMSDGGKDMALLERINNECVGSLKKVTRENVGKTWKQSFELASLDQFLPGGVKLTLTAKEFDTKVLGKLIGVRALSEPFFVKAPNSKGGRGSVKSQVNSLYVFSPDMEDVYMSISVFQADTSMNGKSEKLRHEIATYKTDASGVSVNLSGLGKKFEGFARKVGLSQKALKIVKEGPLPQWAMAEGLSAAQVGNICAATACEGASNPVSMIYVPVARTVAMQSFGTIASIGTAGTISGSLATSLTGVTGMKIAAAPTVMGMSAGTAAAIAGGGTAVAVGASGGGGGSNRSASSP